MPETTHEMKRLQKLNRGDLVILLGELEEELEKTERENESLKSRIDGLAAANSALEQEKNTLARRNGELVDTLQAVNKRLIERENQPANWQAVENFARQLSEASLQAKEQVAILKQLEQKRREEFGSAKEIAEREAAGIVEAAHQQASLMMQRVKVENLRMLSSIQEAVSKAHQGYDIAEKYENKPPAPADGKMTEPVKEAAQVPGEEKQPALSTDQVKKLLKVLKRLNKDEAEEAQ